MWAKIMKCNGVVAQSPRLVHPANKSPHETGMQGISYGPLGVFKLAGLSEKRLVLTDPPLGHGVRPLVSENWQKQSAQTNIFQPTLEAKHPKPSKNTIFWPLFRRAGSPPVQGIPWWCGSLDSLFGNMLCVSCDDAPHPNCDYSSYYLSTRQVPHPGGSIPMRRCRY